MQDALKMPIVRNGERRWNEIKVELRWSMRLVSH